MSAAINPQHVVLFHHFRRFLVEAAKAGLDAAPLKGAHLVTSVYPADADRGVMADVDFLVRPEQFERAGSLLEGLGFYRKPLEEAGRATHERAYYLDVGGGRHIMFEAHRHLFDPVRFPLDHEGLWRRSAASEFDGAPCRRLAPEDHYVHIVFHDTLHRLTSLGRTLRDLELLARHGDADLDLIIYRAREWRLTRAVWLLTKRVDASAPELGLSRIVRELAPARSVRAALELVVPEGRTETRLSRLHHRLQAALLWPLILDSPLQAARLAITHPYVRYCLTPAPR
ncbi:MAG: nucleotidyltransferase family protein [Proteobacteria bacterium]|jgi:hypothetical protein|nr:nucleotidyltransferase family protein [Pseudomonadota bacterium]